MSRTAFVTGGTGFLGLNLVDQLVQGGWGVVALHRPSSDLTYLKRFPVRLAEGRLDDPASLGRAIPEGVDAVFHVAADVNFWGRKNAEQTRNNVDGTRNMVAAALARGARRFVHTSSIAVYGFQEGYDESAPKLGRNSWINYFRTKFLAEQDVLAAISKGLDAVVLNPSNIVGPYDRHSWGRLFRLMVENRLPGFPAGRASFCHAVEVAKAHVAAVDRGRTGENYLLGGTEAGYPEAMAVVADLLGRRPPRTLPAWAARAIGRAFDLASNLTGRAPDLTPELAAVLSGRQICRSEKAARELSYRPVPLREAFEDNYRWLRAEGLLPAG